MQGLTSATVSRNEAGKTKSCFLGSHKFPYGSTIRHPSFAGGMPFRLTHYNRDVTTQRRCLITSAEPPLDVSIRSRVAFSSTLTRSYALTMPFFAGEPAHWVHNTAALHDSARLHYVEVSPGKANGHTLVLLHGFPETWYAFRHVLQPFADLGYRCVAVDYRGAGDSSRPRDGQGYTKMNLAKDVRVLCSEALGVDKVIVVGYDIGSMIAVSMAMQFPEMVEALITFGEYIFYCSRALGFGTRLYRCCGHTATSHL